jgi:plastocyanin
METVMKRFRLWLVCAILAAVMTPLPGGVPARAAGGAETLAGEVRVLEGDSPVADAGDAIVYWIPEGHPAPPRAETREVTTHDRRFAPRVSAVPLGSTVRFPNQDPIRHNVFSVSPGNRFDLGLYGQGPGRSTSFHSPGVVRLFCNVHQSMSAFVLVLDTPYYTQVDAAGHFSLAGLPGGRGTLCVWHPRAATWRGAMELPASAPVTVTLQASLPAIPRHLNKFGQPYPDQAGDEYH